MQDHHDQFGDVQSDVRQPNFFSGNSDIVLVYVPHQVQEQSWFSLARLAQDISAMAISSASTKISVGSTQAQVDLAPKIQSVLVDREREREL